MKFQPADRVLLANTTHGENVTGTIVGSGQVLKHTEDKLITSYAVRLDAQFQGMQKQAGLFISTLLTTEDCLHPVVCHGCDKAKQDISNHEGVLLCGECA